MHPNMNCTGVLNNLGALGSHITKHQVNLYTVSDNVIKCKVNIRITDNGDET